MTQEVVARCRAEDAEKSVKMDIPALLGGKDWAPVTGFYRQVAMGSCTLICLIYELVTREIPFPDISIRVELEVNYAHAFGAATRWPSATRFLLRVESTAGQAKPEAELAKAQAKCIVTNTVQPGTRITTKLEVVSPATADA